MLYTLGKFTLPSSNPKTTQENWDRAFLPAKDFELKYGKVENK